MNKLQELEKTLGEGASISKAEKIYSSDKFQAAMEQAREMFPKYNTISSSDHEEAVVWVLDKMNINNEKLRDELNNMVSAGFA